MKLHEINFIPNRIIQRRLYIKNTILKSIILISVVFVTIAGRYYMTPVLQFKISELRQAEVENWDITQITDEVTKKIKKYNQRETELKQYRILSDNMYNISEFISKLTTLIPNDITLTGVYIKYVEKADNKEVEPEEEVKVNTDSIEDIEVQVVPTKKKKVAENVYERVPNVLVIDGEATHSSDVGIFVNKLTNWNKKISDVKIDSIGSNKDETGFIFTISMLIKDDE